MPAPMLPIIDLRLGMFPLTLTVLNTWIVVPPIIIPMKDC